MTTFKFLNHFTIYCSNMESMLRFYKEVLGLFEFPCREFPLEGHWLDVGDGHYLHLKARKGETDPPLKELEKGGYKETHFGLVTDDLEALKERLRAHFLPFFDEPYGYPQIFFRDPEYNLIEVAADKMFPPLPPPEKVT